MLRGSERSLWLLPPSGWHGLSGMGQRHLGTASLGDSGTASLSDRDTASLGDRGTASPRDGRVPHSLESPRAAPRWHRWLRLLFAAARDMPGHRALPAELAGCGMKAAGEGRKGFSTGLPNTDKVLK